MHHPMTLNSVDPKMASQEAMRTAASCTPPGLGRPAVRNLGASLVCAFLLHKLNTSQPFFVGTTAWPSQPHRAAVRQGEGEDGRAGWLRT